MVVGGDVGVDVSMVVGCCVVWWWWWWWCVVVVVVVVGWVMVVVVGWVVRLNKPNVGSNLVMWLVT